MLRERAAAVLTDGSKWRDGAGEASPPRAPLGVGRGAIVEDGSLRGERRGRASVEKILLLLLPIIMCRSIIVMTMVMVVVVMTIARRGSRRLLPARLLLLPLLRLCSRR